VPVVEVELWYWFAGCYVDDLEFDVERNSFLVFSDVFSDVLSGDICISWSAKNEKYDGLGLQYGPSVTSGLRIQELFPEKIVESDVSVV
jgi:hypothetical protein